MIDSSGILLASSSSDYFKGIANHLKQMGCKVTPVHHTTDLEMLYAEKPSISLFIFSTDLPGLLSFDLVIKGRELYPERLFSC